MVTIHFEGGPKDGDILPVYPNHTISNWMQFGNARYGFERSGDYGRCLYYRFNGFVVTPDEHRYRRIAGVYMDEAVQLGDYNHTTLNVDLSSWSTTTFSGVPVPQPLTVEDLKKAYASMKCEVVTPLHGLEYEFQLVTEIKGVMQTVYVDLFSEHNLCVRPIRYNDYSRGVQPRETAKVKADIGNIEISTEPYKTYKEAVTEAEELLNTKVVPQLTKHLNSFALFLPAPMCILENGAQPPVFISSTTYCLKHWNIDNNTMKAFDNFFSYPYTLKEGITGARIEVKIPYHFTPPENVSEMPPFDSIIIPPANWRPLVGYYRSGKWHQIRPLR